MREPDPPPFSENARGGIAGEPSRIDGDRTIVGQERDGRITYRDPAAPAEDRADAATDHPVGTPPRVPVIRPDRSGMGRLRSWSSAAGGRDRALLPLLGILTLAALLRVYGYSWDEGTNLHPDERAIGSHLASLDLPHSWTQFWSPSSPLNPHFAAYGHLPFYLTVIFGHFLSWCGHTLGGPLAGLVYADTYSGVVESGRVLSGLADTGTWMFAFLIGRHIYGRAAGLLAALLGCFTVLHLEFAHMAGVDTFLGFFTMGALYFCVRVVRFGRPRDYGWAGAWIGFAIACKISGVPLFLPLCVAHFYRGSQPVAPDDLPRVSARRAAQARLSLEAGTRGMPSHPFLLLLAIACSVLAVFVTMPYAFIDFTNWWSDVWGQLQLARGVTDVFFTRKFAGLPAYWYPLQQMIGWTLGPALGLAAVAGIGCGVWRQVRRRRGGEMVLLAWTAVFFGSTAGQYMKYLRYMIPLTPTLVIFAAGALVLLWRWAAGRGLARPPQRLLGRGVVVGVVLLTVLYGLAYEHIYTAENTRIAATRWMVSHIPSGTTITQEGPDETLPWAAPGMTLPPYTVLYLDSLGTGDTVVPPDAAHLATVPMFVNALQKAQYITISSARSYATVAHEPGRYPYTIRWYQLLFGGKLNFRLERTFSSHPQLWASAPHIWPLWVDDYQSVAGPDAYTHPHLWYEADQNMSEYDHPPVFIFKRTGPIDPARATDLLTDNGRLAPAVVAYDPTHSMLLSPTVERADRAAPTYDTAMSVGNPLQRLPLIVWLVMVELLGLLALPLVMRACNSLRDGGYGLAKTCGILIVGYATWLAASLHLAVYSRSLIILSCGLLLVLSLAFGVRLPDLWDQLKARRRAMLWGELVFLGGFLAFVAIRMAYPDLWHFWFGGERTQEISFTNAIVRSRYFPPLDPWFAGGTLNYYYYGQYLTGMLMKLAGLAVPVGFNLALPTLYGLLLTAAFSIGYNATGRLWVGGAAAALDGVLGNLGPVQQFAALNPNHGLASTWPIVGGMRDALLGLLAVVTHQPGVVLPSDFFWTSSRLFPNDAVINEYPIWSFTYGDMHAHVIDEPIFLCVIGLALAASGIGSVTHGGKDHTRPRSLRQLLVLAPLIAVVAGATGPTNLWDLPTALTVVVVGFGLRGYFGARRRGWALVLRDLLMPGVVLGLLSLLLYRPFYASLLGLTSGFTFIAPRDETLPYVLHLGLPLFLLTSFCMAFLLRQTRPVYWLRRGLTAREFSAYYADRAERLPRLYRIARLIVWRRHETAPPSLLSLHILLAGVLLTVAALLLQFPTLALIATLITLATVAFVEVCARWRLEFAGSQAFALALAVLGLALTAIPDLIVQNEAGRMNTFFKLYNQAWPLLALSAALCLSALVRHRGHPVMAPLLSTKREDPSASAMAVGAPLPAGGHPFATPQPVLAMALGGRDDGALTAHGATPVSAGEAPAPRPDRALPAAAPLPGQDGPSAPAPVAATDGHGPPADTAPEARRGRSPSQAARLMTIPARAVAAIVTSSDLRALWWAALILLVGGASLFPIVGTYTHLQLRSGWTQTATAKIPHGLDGSAFMRVLYPGDAAAIDWINGHIRGTPVLLTSGRGGYRNFAGKVTMFTGLPSVAAGIDWTNEDRQERYAGQGRAGVAFPPTWIDQFQSGTVIWQGGRWVTIVPTVSTGGYGAGTRESDVETIYNTLDNARALTLLREYHVSYIYVGTAERGDVNSNESAQPGFAHTPGFDPAGLAKFDRMVTAGQLAVVYHTASVTIYQVKGTG